MDVLRYALSELGFRRGRSLVTVTSVALAVLAAMILTALADSYARHRSEVRPSRSQRIHPTIACHRPL